MSGLSPLQFRWTRPLTCLALACTVAGVSTAQFPSEFRSIDGAGNSIAFPTRGAADTELVRMATPAYADGTSAPSGATRPNARAISNAVLAQTASKLNARGVSDFFWQWGQFIDHDIDLTEGANPVEPFPIDVPTGDPFFDPFSTGMEQIPLNRSIFHVVGSTRQQVNEISAYIDGSMVYGSKPAVTAALRENDGTGRLKTSAGNLLPFDPADPGMFLAGDIRANEQNGLTCMHTLFMREHNFWAGEFAGLLPGASGETLFQYARAMVGAEIQVITYNEWLPILLGENGLPSYSGYDPTIDAGISNAFSTAAFRFGHTMLSSNLRRLDSNLETIANGDILLRDAFFNPVEIVANDIDPLLRGLARQRAQELDELIIDDVRNFLFGAPGSGGFDLGSLNIQRGRDHGLPDYNSLRVAMGLAPKASFAEISSDPLVQSRLASIYPNVNEIDPWVGGLSEDKLAGKMVGEFFFAVLSDQFLRSRDGDRFYYQNYLPAGLQVLAESATLTKIIRRNTSIGTEIQDNAFLVEGSIVNLGGGCGTAGVLGTDGGGFVMGNPLFELEVTGADFGSNVAVLTFATIDPTVFGCGPCQILSPEFDSPPIAMSAGTGSLPLSLPNDPGFFGFVVQTQALVMTPGTGPCIPGIDFSATNRLELTVGQ